MPVKAENGLCLIPSALVQLEKYAIRADCEHAIQLMGHVPRRIQIARCARNRVDLGASRSLDEKIEWKHCNNSIPVEMVLIPNGMKTPARTRMGWGGGLPLEMQRSDLAQGWGNYTRML